MCCIVTLKGILYIYEYTHRLDKLNVILDACQFYFILCITQEVVLMF